MFCKECGAQLADDAQFCPNCGKKVTNTMTVEKADLSPPKKKPAIIMGVCGALVLIAATGIFFVKEKKPDESTAKETAVQNSADVQKTEAPTDISQPAIPEAEQQTNTYKEYPFYAASLITLINESVLPNGELVKYTGDPEINPVQFAICDINKDGKEELLLHLPYDTCEISGHFIYTENAENTGLEDLCRFNEDTVYFNTGFIKEPVSYGECLSSNFSPYDIRMWDAGGFLDAGRVEAWEKLYMPNDFSGRDFPDGVDADGNGIVYFISGELGIDYENPVDDAEYKDYEKQFFGDGEEISVPWLELTLENVKKVTGYTEERIASENISPIYTGESYDDTLLRPETNLTEIYEQVPYVSVTANIIGMDFETYLNNTAERIDLPTDYLQARFSTVIPLISNSTETTYYGYYEKGIVPGVNDIHMVGYDEGGYIKTYCFAPQDPYFDMNAILNEFGINDIEPYIAYSDVRESLLIWGLDNAYLVMAVSGHYANGEFVTARMTSATISQEINGKWLGLEQE